MGFTPSTACGRSPSLDEGGLGIGKARVSGTSAGARCANSFHRCGGPPPSRREVFGVENRRSVECRREIATVRCVCNAGLHHCNGQMYLQPSVAPPTPVGARIARPFVPDVITAIFREGARRVIGATAKPLYAIDGKAEGLDRRSPQTSLLEGGGPPRGRWKELRKAPSKLHMLHMHHMPDTHQAYDVFFSFFELLRSFSANTAPRKTTFPVIPLSPSP